MNYNYVRMRNARNNNDFEKAEYYRKLYESGKSRNDKVTAVDYIILLLLLIALLLGIYILYSETKQAEIYHNSLPVETMEPLPVVGNTD